MCDGVVLTPCDSDTWPEIKFLTGDNYWISLLPEDYVVRSPMSPPDENICYLNIFPSWDNFYLAGNNVLRGYYSVHDMENARLGLVPHTTSTKGPIQVGTLPENQLNAPIDTVGIVKNLIVFALAWAGWATWIIYKVEDVTYLGTNSSKVTLEAEATKSKPSVK